MARALKKASIFAKRTTVRPYAHQQEVHDAWNLEHKLRYFLAWHRRAGKDITSLEFARDRLLETVGSYWHLFPFHTQARRAMWDGIDKRDGMKFIDRAFPDHLRAKTNNAEMSIEFNNGSHWQMLGSDNYDRAIGSNPAGIVFSEHALADPAAWDYFRPILMENGGWAMFDTTFRGRNHAWRMWEAIKDSPDWFASLRTIDDTIGHDGEPIISLAAVEQARREGYDESFIQQEFYCNPDAATSGAVYVKQHARLVCLDPVNAISNSRVLRIAWGYRDEGIAAIAFDGPHIHAVHRFCESNLVDCVQSVARRHPSRALIHHAVQPDPTVFSQLDGIGVVPCVLGDDTMTSARAAIYLNSCHATSLARESLIDFAMSYAPYRNETDDTEKTYGAMERALAVANAGSIAQHPPRKPLVYPSDRGVI